MTTIKKCEKTFHPNFTEESCPICKKERQNITKTWLYILSFLLFLTLFSCFLHNMFK
jgi:hypothetical protein